MVNTEQQSAAEVLKEEIAAKSKRRAFRMFLDRQAHVFVASGGIFVIIALLLIFFYLFYTTLPLFKPAHIEDKSRYLTMEKAEKRDGASLHLGLDETGTVGARVTSLGSVIFFNTTDGSLIKEEKLPVKDGQKVAAFSADGIRSGNMAIGFSDGKVLIFQCEYSVSYDKNGRRIVSPSLEYPFGQQQIELDKSASPIQLMAFRAKEDGAAIAFVSDGKVSIADIQAEKAFLSDEVTVSSDITKLDAAGKPEFIVMNHGMNRLFLVEKTGNAQLFNIANLSSPSLAQELTLSSSGKKITAMTILSGGASLIVGHEDGTLAQWFDVADASNKKKLTFIRDFKAGSAPIASIVAEDGRKCFYAIDQAGLMAIYHSTAHRLVTTKQLSASSLIGLSPRADYMLEDREGQVSFYALHNEHPDISWSYLWGKVWYENYKEPAYIWQSSAANDDFEAKLSLVPITFGTFKAAFYSLLFAVPIAILGAIYAAYFMSPSMRAFVKPSIEIMGALPTVILGFLAGLWLAPFVEQNVPGLICIIFGMFPVFILISYLWEKLPDNWKQKMPDGLEAVFLVPIIIFASYLFLGFGPVLERVFFGGDFRLWVTSTLNIPFDQRNSIIVGIAMGIAVIPTIFTIAEDAIFGVPGHLSKGSLALGATPWQTLVRVVLPTASPGIFSAIMMGLGRAVGETMIVLMATGNTPVMDFNVLQGLRTLSANIAVEMAEAEVNSTHFRVLFLSGLVLFFLTFIFNTAAEVIRHRLRKKYSSI